MARGPRMARAGCPRSATTATSRRDSGNTREIFRPARLSAPQGTGPTRESSSRAGAVLPPRECDRYCEPDRKRAVRQITGHRDMSAIGRPRPLISTARLLRHLKTLPATRGEIKGPELVFSQPGAGDEDPAAIRGHRRIPIAHLSAGTQLLFGTGGTGRLPVPTAAASS